MPDQKDPLYTDIEIIVFEGTDGDIEMEVLDEFPFDGQNFIALRPPLDANGQLDDEDLIHFFRIDADEDGSELYDLVVDAPLLAKLADQLESRLLKD